MYCPNSNDKCYDFTEGKVLYRVRRINKSLRDNHRDEKLSANKSIIDIFNGGLVELRTTCDTKMNDYD